MIKPLTATLRPHVLAQVLGKTCRLNRYAQGINRASGFSAREAENLISWQESHGLTFVFIDEAPVWHGNRWLYCIAELPDLENWYWFYLDQLLICEA